MTKIIEFIKKMILNIIEILLAIIAIFSILIITLSTPQIINLPLLDIPVKLFIFIAILFTLYYLISYINKILKLRRDYYKNKADLEKWKETMDKKNRRKSK